MKIRWTIEQLNANGWTRVAWYIRWYELQFAHQVSRLLNANKEGIEYRVRLRRV